MLAMLTTFLAKSGCSIAKHSACIPPRLPPMMARTFFIPSLSKSLICAFTTSLIASTGKRKRYCAFLFGSMLSGLVEPKGEPKISTQITKYLLVSMHLPSPIRASHQPGFGSLSSYLPAAWWLPVSAWHITMILLSSLARSP